ncbi:hypothetical protein J2T60_000537 [Natronospira proteinivora]|uniref:Uncharacterized protein n=1 Tax=Natronospira proteinivora TaxID=1807133 RepID=A0ABT1G5J0_9GAMM|nr:hypothetical protein [Natronospira proteinivora]MCP1726572.1 hypothetical protein [Natronospira proteinivora]
MEDAKKAGITDIDVLEATDYYKTPRGQAPQGKTSFLFSRRAAAVDWDAFHLAEVLLTQPLLVVIGDKPGGFGAYRDRPGDLRPGGIKRQGTGSTSGCFIKIISLPRPRLARSMRGILP